MCRSGLAENWASESFLSLLLQSLALLQPVADVGDDVAHTRIRVITGKKGSSIFSMTSSSAAISGSRTVPVPSSLAGSSGTGILIHGSKGYDCAVQPMRRPASNEDACDCRGTVSF